jgi:5-methylcytosine-specific restriction endonuclease McrA
VEHGTHVPPSGFVPGRASIAVQSDVLSDRVLVLNRYFQAVQLTTVRRAFVLLYGGVATAVAEDGELFDFEQWRDLEVRPEDEGLPIVGGVLRVPRVVHLARYERTPRPIVRLTRRNLMIRDGHQCQYCGKKPPLRDLNIDHILPRSRGGEDTWENLVTACRVCNLRKGWRTPEEAGMHLVHRPVRPRWTTTAQILLEACRPFKEWEPFLKAG